MTNKKSTKRVLICSILALAMCFSMLVGTTFAWFTDSVTSKNNIIKSGNLDIELEYWNGSAWVDVAGKSDILTNNLWEPGVTEVAYLRVANAGSLALKYQLGINIVSETAGVNAAGETFKLSDYIQFGVKDIKADATNPGGITATGKAVVKTTGKSGVKDRPIIRFYNGVFTGTNVISHSGSNGTNCPQFQFHGGVFNGTITANRALIQFYGGTFNGSLMMSVDSSAYALISGGRFKQLNNNYGSALNTDKFTKRLITRKTA